jgi:hypothetical protein
MWHGHLAREPLVHRLKADTTLSNRDGKQKVDRPLPSGDAKRNAPSAPKLTSSKGLLDPPSARVGLDSLLRIPENSAAGRIPNQLSRRNPSDIDDSEWLVWAAHKTGVAGPTSKWITAWRRRCSSLRFVFLDCSSDQCPGGCSRGRTDCGPASSSRSRATNDRSRGGTVAGSRSSWRIT